MYSRQFKRALQRGYIPVTTTQMWNFPASINRHTGLPHENKREKARNSK